MENQIKETRKIQKATPDTLSVLTFVVVVYLLKFILSFVIGLSGFFFFLDFALSGDSFVSIVAMIILSLVILSGAVFFATLLMNRIFVVKNKNKVVLKAAFVFAFLMHYRIMFNFLVLLSSISSFLFIISDISVFYIVGRTFLKEDTLESAPTTSV